MATERFEIQVAAVGAKDVARDIKSIGTEASVARSALSFLRASLVVIASARIVGTLFDTVDAFTNMGNRLKLVTNNTDELNAVQKSLFVISQETRTSLEANNDVFAKLAQTTTHLHLTYQQLLDTTEAVAIAVQLSGSTAESARLGLIQFGQGLALGTLRGQDLKSVVEQLPYLANVIGKEFGVAGASLATFANNNPGIITTDRVVKALRDSLAELRTQVQANDVTISQSFERLKNALIFFLGNASKMSGAGKAIADGLKVAADHIDLIVEGLTALAGVVVLNILIDQALRLGTVIRFLALGGFSVLANAVRLVVLPLTALSAVFTPLGLAVLALAGAAYYFRDSIVAILPSLQQLRDGFNRVFAFIRAGIETVIEEWQNFKTTITSGDFWKTVVNKAKQGFIDIQNTLIEAKNKAAFDLALAEGRNPMEASYTPLIPNLDPEKLKLPESAQSIAEKFKELFNKYLQDDTVGDVKAGVEGLMKKLHEFTLSGLDMSGINDLLSKFPKPQLNSGLIDQSKLKGAAKSILEAISPLAKAGIKIQEFEAALADPKQAAILKDLMDKFDLTADIVKNRTVRSIIGLGNTQTDVAEKTKLLTKYFGDNKDMAAEVALAIDKLKNVGNQALNGIVDSVDQLSANQRKLRTTTLELNVAVEQHRLTEQRRDQLLVLVRRDMDGVGNAVFDYANKIRQLNQDLRDGVISQQEFTFAAQESKLAFLNTQHDLMSGVQRGLLQVQHDALNLGQSVGDAIANGFHKAEDTLVDFVMTGKFNFKDLADSIISDLIRIQIRTAILGPIAQILGSFAGIGSASTIAEQSAAFNVNDIIAGLPARASGGPVVAGQAYMVGERGPEPFIPTQNGVILPNGTSVGGGKPTVTVTVINSVDGAQATATRSTNADGTENIEIMLQKSMASAIRKSGSPVNKALRETFDLSSPVTQR